ncbi:1-phosphofructokinase family hexose kinase [Curtobacterium ammoniigenes]|uniref:1-phosphofructokinase family hexose kinase n=1 Tax=Curtobacterium ammoniigenes TaxID=395387 RepID=UPI00083642FF|nr:hexose kinase [Curtobacterium ammoniigenes]
MSARIVTVTPNPSFDRTIDLAGELQRGAVQRAVATTAEPGGKGVNVSRAIARSGGDTLAVLPGDPADPVIAALADRGIPTATLPIGAPLRSNVTITEPSGTTTKLNEPGPSLAGRQDAFVDLIVRAAAGARWVVLAGSLPPGLDDSTLALIVAALRAQPNPPRIAVDSSGEPFLAVLRAGLPIDLIKPNAEELAEVVGGDADAYEEDPTLAAAAASRLVADGVGAVLLTLGGAGAVLVTADGAWMAAAPRIVARSTVGAGDSALAGYLLAESSAAGPERCLAQAVASGSAAAALPGSLVPALDQTAPDAIAVVRLAPSVASVPHPIP